MSPVRTCVGCGVELTGQVSSREHVLAQWIRDEIEKPTLTYKHYLRNEGEVTSHLLRDHGLNNLAVKIVCSGCNNGWMSRLEESAKPLVIGLMNQQTSLLQLSSRARITVSKWAAKTAFMIASAQQSQLALPWPVFKNLSREAPECGPDGCFVLGSQLSFLPNGFMCDCQSDAWQREGTPIQVRVGFSVCHLHLLVVLPLGEAERVISTAACVHVPLWPLEMEVLVHYENFPTFNVASDLIIFLTGLVQVGIVRKTANDAPAD